MDRSQALSIAIGCVMGSELDMKDKGDVIRELNKLETDAKELQYWCQVAKDILPTEMFDEVQYAYEYHEEE